MNNSRNVFYLLCLAEIATNVNVNSVLGSYKSKINPKRVIQLLYRFIATRSLLTVITLRTPGMGKLIL